MNVKAVHAFVELEYCGGINPLSCCVAEKLAEATRKFANLQSDLREAQDDKIKPKDAGGNLKPVKRKILRKNTTTRKTQELKLAFSEFYLSLILLQNYQNLNYTGFRKIMKKHDKV